jgi:L-lactate dehydrogenase complex protein LldG
VALFCERVADYRATVVRVRAPGIGAAIAAACEARGSRRVIAAGEWDAPGVNITLDDPSLPARELDGFDAALTGCALAIAETGTIVLDGGARQGRRALTLVPDYHLCVISERAICDLVPEAVERLEEAVGQGRPLTFISGPSATSDIELNRVEGVHGPRTLHVLIAG